MAQNPWAGFDDHEQALVAVDPTTGIRIVIALHSTALGPGLGGVRMSAYSDATDPAAAAYGDALRLSQAMSFKNALAGLPHGGGKAVIVTDPGITGSDRRTVLQAFARLVSSLDGRYVTAGDVGVTVDDLDFIGETCPWTTGRSPERGGAGDSAILTALGVFTGMQAAAEHLWGSAELHGRRIALVGAGKVGGRLARHLSSAGAQVTVFDPSPAALAALADVPGLTVASSLDDLWQGEFDICSPNALGGLLTHERANSLRAAMVCGAANNQLAEPAVAEILGQRGITYVPDFAVNAGGVIQIAEELTGLDMERARERTLAIGSTVRRILARADSEGISPVQAAEQEARERISAAH